MGGNTRMDQIVRFYFSFRSPYAWFAAERWQVELGDLKPVVEHIPFYPTPETFPNDPTRVPAKFAYVLQDMRRLARDFGLGLRPPPALDTDWARAHAAYLGVRAAEPARAEAFMLEMFRGRFSRGQDVATAAAIQEASQRAGVDARVALQAAASLELQTEVSANFSIGQARDRIFGAPSFVYGDQLFWGHDRMHHLRRALLESAGTKLASASDGDAA
jgi:2-hydroxychromene-2-carboxylate isomerase